MSLNPVILLAFTEIYLFAEREFLTINILMRGREQFEEKWHLFRRALRFHKDKKRVAEIRHGNSHFIFYFFFLFLLQL